MDSIKTYIVNLESAKVRRSYMEDLLAQYDILDVEFIIAVDGRKLNEEEKDACFDEKKCISMLGRPLSGGEIGCVLSHRKCYTSLMKSKAPYALILEDDISIIRDLNLLKNINLDSILNVSSPVILMISGDYWFWKKGEIVNVYDCIGSYAYFINKAAAETILKHKACLVADSWSYYKSLGIKLRAVYPYMVDANLNMDLLSSDVDQYSWGACRSKMSKLNAFKSLYTAFVKRILKYTNHFEYKITVRNGKAEPGTKH